MSEASLTVSNDHPEVVENKQRTLWQEAWRRFKKSRLAVVGLIFLGLLTLIALGTSVIDIVTKEKVYDAYVISQNMALRLQGPTLQHPFGLDEFGRDILLRVLWGTRYSLFLGVSAIIVSATIGGLLGSLSGFYGNMLDNVIMRFMDILLAIPSTLLAIAIVAALGTSLVNITTAIAISYIPTFARIVRAAVMSIKDQEFIEAARSVGASDARIIIKYIIPNSMAPIIVQSTLGVASAILSIAGLSFLGLGIQPPMPEWGAMLTNARAYMRDAWHITVIPGTAIMLTILSLNLVGDGLRDALDPKLKN